MIAATFAIIGLLAIALGIRHPWRVVACYIWPDYVRWGIRWDRIALTALGTILLICAVWVS